MATLRKFTKKFFIISNIIVVVLFLLSCANGFLHPDKWWVISLLGLIFPLLLVLVLVFFIFWLLSSRRWALLSFAALVIGWQNIHTFFAFDMGASFKDEKQPGTFRVLTWNVRSWDEFVNSKKGNSAHRKKMMEFLQKQDADILCFQEFFVSNNPQEPSESIPYIQKQLNMPYYFFSKDYHRYDWAYESGVIIFSKFPISNTLKMKYGGKDTVRATESLIAADISINGMTARIFTTHLQSVLFQNKDFHNIEIIKNVEDSILEASKSVVKKLRRAYSFRSAQADLVRGQLDQSTYPAIICGDFNDVPNSYTYFHIRGDKQDAFIKKGFGIGRTYVNLSPTLRIDYILADQQFTVVQSKRFNLPYSDHHPVVADFRLPGSTR
jgi:endonuclease/exonuclease/phosphatase family metal-dependent hydrolase